MTRKEAVYKGMRRKLFEKLIQLIHFADNSSLDKADIYAKI